MKKWVPVLVALTPTDEPSETETPESAVGRVIASEKASSIGPIAMSGDTLAYPFAVESDSWNTVRTSKGGVAETVARSEWDTGLINWVALGGHWLAYVDQDHTQGDGSMEVLWRVWAVDLRDDSRVLLSSNGDTPDPFVPEVNAGGGYFFWPQAEKDRSAHEFAWKPGWSEPHSLLNHADMTPGTETYSRDAIVYLGANGKGLKGHTTGGDCWRVGMDGGAPTVLTHTALAMGCAASDDTLIWTQHIAEDDHRSGEAVDDPFTTWTLDLEDPDAVPIKIFQGIQSGLYPVAGDGFVAWATDGKSYLVRSTTSGRTVKVRGGMSMAASGSRLAVSDFDRGVAEITLYDAP